MSALLSVQDLGVRFSSEEGVVRAVDGISYELEPGRVLGVVGESGSGKTVGALTLLGLTRGPRTEIRGRALFEGRDLLALPEAELRALRGNEIAMVFQDPLSALHPLLRVGAQLAEAVQAHRRVGSRQARERAAESLALVGIPGPRAILDRFPHELSGGMRQRVMIAMALINEPKLLIADEPTTALDVTVQAEILELLARLRDELGTAIVVVTHDLGVVASIADDVAVMYAGQIVEHAPVERIFAGPEHPYTWGLLGSIPRPDAPAAEDAALLPIAGRPPSLVSPPSGCRFHPRCPYVREAHRTVEPQLEPVAAGERHVVRCLLPAQTRRRLWAELRAGAAPPEARARVMAAAGEGDR